MVVFDSNFNTSSDRAIQELQKVFLSDWPPTSGFRARSGSLQYITKAKRLGVDGCDFSWQYNMVDWPECFYKLHTFHQCSPSHHNSDPITLVLHIYMQRRIPRRLPACWDSIGIPYCQDFSSVCVWVCVCPNICKATLQSPNQRTNSDETWWTGAIGAQSVRVAFRC